MSEFRSSHPAPKNRLLAVLPPEDLSHIWPRLEAVETCLRQVIYAPGEPIDDVYFPESGWVSMMALLEDGSAAEVGIIGFDGMIGLPLLLGSDRAATEAMVQAPGTLLRLSAKALQEEQKRSEYLRKILLRYALAFQAQVAQTAACNGHHTMDQRLARWLLTAHARSHVDSFPMTQEFLAIMLCVHRSGVTITARLFQQAGFISYSSGQITIVDRAGLEAVACECHGVVSREFQRLLGFSQVEGIRTPQRRTTVRISMSRRHLPIPRPKTIRYVLTSPNLAGLASKLTRTQKPVDTTEVRV